jgi:hypothetical protein
LIFLIISIDLENYKCWHIGYLWYLICGIIINNYSLYPEFPEGDEKIEKEQIKSNDKRS